MTTKATALEGDLKLGGDLKLEGDLNEMVLAR
jgi:hypothetical protein